MEKKQSIISGKAENITQVTINGVQMSDVASFVEMNINSLRNELSENRRYVDGILENKIRDISQKLDHKYSISELGTFRSYMRLVETYSDRPDRELAHILCDILAESLPAKGGTILRASLTEAIETARLLNKSQMNLLAFIFLLRNCVFKGVDTFKDFEVFVKDILWKFYPDCLSSQVLPKHLEYSKCTTFVSREMLISRMLTNSYLPAIERDISACASGVMEILCSASESHNTNAIPETSRLSKQVFGLHNLSKKFAPNSEDESHYNTRKGNDEHKAIEKKVVNLILGCQDGEKTYVEWASSPIKNHVLTPVGIVIAISTIRNEFGFDLDYSKWIY